MFKRRASRFSTFLPLTFDIPEITIRIAEFKNIDRNGEFEMKHLVIAEKPSGGRDIVRVLGCGKKNNSCM